MNLKTLLLCSLFFLGCYLPSSGQLCPTNIGFEFGTTAGWVYSKGTVAGTTTTGPFYTMTTTATPTTGNWFNITSGAGTDRYGGFPVVAPGGGSYSLKIGHDTDLYCAEQALYNVEIPAGTTNYSLIYHYATVLENPPTGHTAFQMPRLVVTATDSATGAPIACISYTYVASSTLPGFFHSSVTSDYILNGADVYYKPWTTGNMKFNGENGRTVTLQFTASDCTEGGHFGYGYIDMSCGLFAVSTITCGTTTATLSAPPGYSSYQWLDSTTFSISYGTLATETIGVPTMATTYAVICTPYTGYGCPDTLYTHLTPTALATAPSDDTSICAGASVVLSPNSTDISLPLTYSWSPSAGLSCTTCGTVTATPSATTAYSVTTTDAGGCLHTNVINVTVYPNPTVITGTGNVCAGSTMTLGDATSGGRWASGSTTIATVGSVSGTVGGVSSGPATITYSFGSGLCAITATVNVNPLPPAITGTANVCAGLTTTLNDASTPGTWSSSVTSTATVGSATGIVGGVVSGNSTITFTSSFTGCARTIIVTVNPLPSTPSGVLSVCAGVTTSLLDGGTGTWSSGTPSVATVVLGTGVVSGVATGTALITYTLPTTCLITTTVTVNTAPLPITGTLSVCSGATTSLSDATTGGTWTSSNTGVATITGGGIVSGNIPSTSSITYTAPGGCQAFATVTVNMLPGPISAPSSLCSGSTASVTDGGTGTWSSSNLSAATVTPVTGIVTGVSVPGAADTIIYTLSDGCATTTVINIYPLPPPIMGTRIVCEGGGITTLSDSITYGTWSSSNTGVATIDELAGTVTGEASSGTAIISYTLPPYSCMVTAIVTVNPSPSPIIGPPPNICSGSSLGLSDGGGGTWSSSSTFIASVGSISGVVTGSVVTSTTSTLITYTLPTGCSISEAVTVFPPPGTITGIFNICVGQSVFLSDGSGGTWAATNGHATISPTLGILNGVSAGIDTISYRAGTSGCTATAAITVNSTPGPIVGTLTICVGATSLLTDAGTGTWTSGSPTVATAGLSSGIISGVASGTSVITYSLGGSCVASTIVTVNQLPPLCTVSGGGSYCAGSTGASIYCGPTTAGVSYQLYLGGVAVGSPVPGSGGTVDFGPMTAAGIYSVIATNISTGCSRPMTGTASVSVNPLPLPHSVTGGGSFCAGGAGVPDSLNGSDIGVTYTLILGGSVVAGPIAGTGSAISFGLHTAGGVYTVLATNTATGCTSAMSGSATIIVNLLPTPYPVTGGGAYCAGGAGVHVVVGGSSPGVSYQLYSSGIAVGLPIPGTGSSLNFGPETTAGTYSVVATSTSTGCTSTMTGSVMITINPVPVVTGATAVCAGASIMETAPGFTGGTWSSGSTAVASVGATTGLVTGGASSGSSAVITYIAAGTGCTGTALITITASPGPISGFSSVCIGSSAIEADATTGGTWVSSSTSIASIGYLSGIVLGVATGTATITYSLGTGCTVTKVMTITPALAAISGSAGVCVGASTTLTDAATGGAWSSSNNVVASLIPGTGSVVGMSSGTAVITYTLGACTSTMIMTVNAIPALILGPSIVCAGLTIPETDAVTGGVWTSGSSFATVNSSSGMVTGASPGTATISYSLGGGCPVSTVITVTPAPALITGASGLCLGATASLGETATGGVWSLGSAPSGVITVSTGGVVTGAAIGTATITYSLGGCTTSFPMTVNPAPAAISGPSVVCVGSFVPYSDTVSSGAWSSSNTLVATITSGGDVWGASGGAVTISYSLGASCIVTRPITVNSISPVTGGTAICAGATTSLADGATGGTWSSGTTIAATVGGTGIVSGALAGTSLITYTTARGCTATTVITVNPLPTPVTGTEIICTGSASSLSASITGGLWTSGSTSIATAGSVSGAITGGTPGTATITYSLPTGCIASAIVTINAAPAPILGITNMCVGSATALVEPFPGAWSSDNNSVATVTGSGLVTGVSFGTATISYLYYGCTSITTVSVNSLPEPITGVTSFCVGTTAALTGYPDGGSWSSSNPPLATVDATAGIVTGMSPGNALIAYSLGVGCTVTTTITIDSLPQPIAGVPEVCLGLTTALHDASPLGIWSSSNTATAPISFVGVVSGVSGGPVTISYTNGNGCSATRLVTVVAVPSIVGLSNVCAFSSNVNVYDSVGAGTWTSSSVTISSTGLINAYSAGMASITYTVPLGCYADTSFMVNPSPGPITGAVHLCVDVTTVLSDTSRSGAWSSSNTHIAPVGPTGSVTGSSPGSVVISYAFPTGCMETDTVTVYPPPSAISGSANVCTGSSAILGDLVPGGTWSSSNTALAAIGLSTGNISGVYPGTVTITYYLGVSCSASREITVDPLPAVYDVTGGGNYCAGGTGVHIGLTGSVPGITYVLYRGGSFVVSVAGTGVAEDFGLQTAAGTYTAIATSPATSCINNMSGGATVAINPTVIPSISIVASEDTVCQGTPVTFYATAVNGGSSPAYQWMVNGTAAGASALSYSYTPANHDVVDVLLMSDTACASPVDTVSNSVTIAVDNPLPLIVNISAIPGSAIAPGDAITLTATVTNGSSFLTYQWLANNVPIPGATSATYSNNNFYPGDSLSCYVISSGICGTSGSGHIVFTPQPPGNVGVRQLSLESGITVLPNPNKGEFTVKGAISNTATGNVDEEVSLEITDMLGQVVYKDKVVTNNGLINYKISLSNIVANGMYILNVRSGAESSVFHIVIEQ